jgi:hypothetical protein
MPRTLTAPHGAITFSNLQWGLMVKLAYDHGWKPWGVRPPEDWIASIDPSAEGHASGAGSSGGGGRGGRGGAKRWHFMDYFSLKRQQIVAGDALAMADAIERALPDIPTHDALSHKVIQEIQLPDVDEPLRMMQPGVTVNAFEFFSGANRRILQEFITLCRSGSQSAAWTAWAAAGGRASPSARPTLPNWTFTFGGSG